LNTLISKETQLFTAFLAVSNFYRAVDTVNHERHRTWGRQLAGSFPSHALPGHPSIQRIARTREAASVSPPCSFPRGPGRSAPAHASSLSVCNGARPRQPCFNAHACHPLLLSRGFLSSLVPRSRSQSPAAPARPGHDSTALVSRGHLPFSAAAAEPEIYARSARSGVCSLPCAIRRGYTERNRQIRAIQMQAHHVTQVVG
jgi:hypothetical protein